MKNKIAVQRGDRQTDRPKIDKSKIKTWFVTGASTGVGHEICRQLLETRDGMYNVIAVSRRIPDFNHPNALCLSVDITKPEEIKKAMQQGIEKFGRIDVLANNAGLSGNITIEEETMSHMREVFETNYWGTFNTIYEFLPYFRANKNGTIINNTSMHGLLPRYRGAAYCSSKFAIEGLTGVARLEAQKFCRVMAYELGWFAGTGLNNLSVGKITEIPEYQKIRDFYGNVNYKFKNKLETAVKNIIDEVEYKEMRHRLMLGDDCLYRVNKEMEIRREDWIYSKEMIPGCTEIIVPAPSPKKQEKKNLLHSVFSIKNEYSKNKRKHKVLTVMGVKMKFETSGK